MGSLANNIRLWLWPVCLHSPVKPVELNALPWCHEKNIYKLYYKYVYTSCDQSYAYACALCPMSIPYSNLKIQIPNSTLLTIELPCWNIGNGFAMPCYTVMPLCRCINILFALDVTGLATSNIGKPYTSASCHTLCTGHHAPHVPSCTPTPLP